MDKNNSSANQQYTGKDANDNANERKNQNVQNEGNENPLGKSTSQGNAGLGKGTGLSNEANSSQTEESWQGTGGSMANETQKKNMEENDSNPTSKNYSGAQNSGTGAKMNDGNRGNNDNSFNNTATNKEKTDVVNSNDASDGKK